MQHESCIIALRPLEQLAFERLVTLARRSGDSKTVRFPDIFCRLCPLLCMKKAEAWKVLRRLQEQGCVEIVPFRGIRIMRGEGV